jgi:hypothetical protein
MMWRTMVVAVVFVSVFAATGCKKKDPCPPDMVSGFFEVSPQQALSAVKDFCAFPSDLAKMLKGISQAGAEQRALLIARTINEDIGVFKRVCPKANEVFRGIGNVPEAQRISWMYDQCSFAQLGLADKAELAKTDLSTLWVGAMVYGWLKEEGVKDARRIARHMLALE